MKTLLVLVAISVLFHQTSAQEKVRYDGFKVIRLTPKSQEAVDVLRALEQYDLAYDFWTEIRGVGIPVDVMVPPHLRYRFDDSIRRSDFEVQEYISDVQRLIDNERSKTPRETYDVEWTDYHTLDEINQWLADLAEQDPGRVTLLTAGQSYEERDILGVRVSFSPDNVNRTVFIESNIHAREWISSAVATYILNELLTSTNATIRRIAESYDWIVVPIFNPDGFVYSHTTDRLWRKTRVPYGVCYGVDPNRNWGYHFDEGGTSSDPCSETYNGPNAFSEPSTKSVSEFITTVAPTLRAYIDLHSYSQLILIPYGYSSAHLDNYNDLYTVGLRAAASLAQRYGTQFDVGNIVDILYVASGGSIDWVKGTFQTPITYAYELRDTGRYGFVLPADQIIPSGEETLDSLITVLDGFAAILD